MDVLFFSRNMQDFAIKLEQIDVKIIRGVLFLIAKTRAVFLRIKIDGE
jgi:hypothetical protein